MNASQVVSAHEDHRLQEITALMKDYKTIGRKIEWPARITALLILAALWGAAIYFGEPGLYIFAGIFTLLSMPPV